MGLLGQCHRRCHRTARSSGPKRPGSNGAGASLDQVLDVAYPEYAAGVTLPRGQEGAIR